MGSPKPFDTNVFFAGGAGMFIEYHDVVRPVYLMAVMKLLTSKTTYGLPVDILRPMSLLSLIEWYLRRRYRNPLRCLDYLHRSEIEELDQLLLKLLVEDPSLYRLAPQLNLQRLLAGYHRQGMSFPIYVYTEHEEPGVAADCEIAFQGLPVKYLFGDLERAVQTCDQNFTYMLSSVDTLVHLTEILAGTCSHLLLAGDYRYNYASTVSGTFKADLKGLMQRIPYLRLESNTVCDPTALALALHSVAGKNDHREDI